MQSQVLEATALTLLVIGVIVGVEGCPKDTFWITNRCCVDITSKAGEQPVICSLGDPFSSSVEPCPPDTFSADSGLLSNRDTCRLKTNCNRPHMKYIHHGSRVHNAMCDCEQGYYLIEEPHNCLRNPLCAVGYGQDGNGACVDCKVKGGFSDRVDRDQACLTHTDCRSLGLCVISEGTPSSDTDCGTCKTDLNVSTPEATQTTTSVTSSTSDFQTTLPPKNTNVDTATDHVTAYEIIVHYVIPSAGAIVALSCCVCLLKCLIMKFKTTMRGFRFAEVRAQCRQDDQYREKVVSSATEVLPGQLGKTWKRYCYVIFKGLENRPNVHDILQIDHGVYGTENVIQEMLLKFQRFKMDDPNTVDILFDGLEAVGKGDLIEKVMDRVGADDPEPESIELQDLSSVNVES